MRGATDGAGNTKPKERIFAWMKASKSRGFVCGSRFRSVSEQSINGQGAELF